MNRIIFFKITALILLLLSCSAKKDTVRKEPAAEVQVKRISPYDSRLSLNDMARSLDFKSAMSKISKISLKYETSCEEQIIWKNSLEKNILRTGILVTEEAKRDPLLETDDEVREMKSDAVLVIEKIVLHKIESARKDSGFTENLNDYRYAFFVAEISGKIVLKNGDVIWSSGVSVSTFDLMKIYESAEPFIQFSKSPKFRYSEKLGEWIRDGWSISAEDNFQKLFKSSFDESRHKSGLIELAVSGFIGNLKSESIVSGR